MNILLPQINQDPVHKKKESMNDELSITNVCRSFLIQSIHKMFIEWLLYKHYISTGNVQMKPWAKALSQNEELQGISEFT